MDSTSYKDLIDNTSTFSSANCHTGAVCRKYVGTYDITTAARGEKRIITVTLMVYRPNSRGGIDGRSVTVNIDLEHARTKGGIRYE